MTGVILGGALLAPWLYALAQQGANSFPVLRALAQQPFHRYVHRSWLVLALLGLWPLLRSLGVRSSGEIGLMRPSGQWRRWSAGFALGFGSLACLALLAVGLGARGLAGSVTAADLFRQLAGAILAALGVSILEEILFRGVLFGSLRKAFRWPVALVISSAVYALVHFFQKPEWFGPVGWASGLALAPGMLRGFGEFRALVPGFFNLTLAGVLLGLAFQRTGNLYFSFGLHAGWIFWLRFYGVATRPLGDRYAWFWGTNRLTDGWLALIILSLVLVFVMRLPAADKVPAQAQ
ncbi:MAG: CPBP family intramembrane glutamic endopeptidase [Limisphaerales bacterium]